MSAPVNSQPRGSATKIKESQETNKKMEGPERCEMNVIGMGAKTKVLFDI